MVLLCSDHDELRSGKTGYYTGSWSCIFGGPTCPLIVSSKKAQRVSWSTSHSETNPAVSCAAMADIIASRFTEIEYVRLYRRAPSARDLLEMHVRSQHIIPVDLCTDAMNLFELVCFSKSLPNDKHHRVGILALREDRLTRRLRNVIHLPTGIMLADQLTKKMMSAIYMHFATTGVWLTRVTEKAIRIQRAVRRPRQYTEQDLMINRFDSANGSICEDLDVDDIINILDALSRHL